MRSLRLFLLLLPVLFLGISSCCEEDPFIPTKTGPVVDRSRSAFVRIIHASATAPGVVVTIDGEELFGGATQEYLGFKTGVNEGKYYPMDTSYRRIAFRSSGGELAALDDMDLVKGGFYTIYLYGDAKGFGVMRTRDTVTPTPGTCCVKLRVVNLAPGSPDLDIHLEKDGPAVVENVRYATVKEYEVITRSSASSGLYVKKDGTDSTIFGVPPPYIILPTDAVITLVMTGSLEPKGDDPFLSLGIFSEGYLDRRDSLYGNSIIPINFAAVRFANLVPLTPDSSLSVSFLDSTYGKDYAMNQFFRRNLPGQDPVLTQVYPLGNDKTLGMQQIRPYMLLANLLTSRYPYRIELGTRRASEGPTEQPVLAEKSPGRGFDFTIEPNRRYTIVAFGPKVVGQARTVILNDNTRAPSSDASITFRFFHGGLGADTQNRRLRVRINGVDSPLMSYGDAPDGRLAVEAPAGATRIELFDESGALLHTETLPKAMSGGQAYTIFLSRGAFGNSLVLTEVSEALNLIY